jgi:hypothetical protein
MDQESNGVAGNRRETEELEHEIESIRDNLGAVVGELDRRRHELLDWRLQLRRHKKAVALFALGTLTLIGGFVALKVLRHRQRRRATDKLRRLGEALSRMIEHPEDVARPTPSVGKRILAAAGGSVTSALGKKIVRGR